MQTNEAAEVMKETYVRWKKLPLNLLAGGLAYFALFSAAPLVTIMIGMLSWAVSKSRVVAQLNALLGPRIGDIVQSWLLPGDGHKASALTFLSVVMLVYGASQVFIQLRIALDLIWG